MSATDSSARACPACAGNGFAPRHAAHRSPCKVCHGSGRRRPVLPSIHGPATLRLAAAARSETANTAPAMPIHVRAVLDALAASDMDPDAKQRAWDLIVVGSLHLPTV